ncbi:pseudouridine synthase [Clostridia bacterium]|nr:pseudouridine synthase [Clostridia bacterium]
MAWDRLDKILSSQNLGSRTVVKQLLKSKAVTVNGQVITAADFKTNTEEDEIKVSGNVINVKKHIYIMMNKPAGVVTASRDNRDKTVFDLVPKELYRKDLFAVGRLDKDTEGLLIITNDGDFAHNVLSPAKKVYKLYEAIINEPITEKDIEEFKDGIVFADGTKCLPAKLWSAENGGNKTVFIEICEGKFHQVKKMFLAIGKKVVFLKRIKIGGLELYGNLHKSECRELEKLELNHIFDSKMN